MVHRPSRKYTLPVPRSRCDHESGGRFGAARYRSVRIEDHMSGAMARPCPRFGEGVRGRSGLPGEDLRSGSGHALLAPGFRDTHSLSGHPLSGHSSGRVTRDSHRNARLPENFSRTHARTRNLSSTATNVSGQRLRAPRSRISPRFGLCTPSSRVHVKVAPRRGLLSDGDPRRSNAPLPTG